MLDIDKLSDDEVAVLTYAIEHFHDDARGGGWYSITERVSGSLLNKLGKEYAKRNLHWSHYQKD